MKLSTLFYSAVLVLSMQVSASAKPKGGHSNPRPKGDIGQVPGFPNCIFVMDPITGGVGVLCMPDGGQGTPGTGGGTGGSGTGGGSDGGTPDGGRRTGHQGRRR